LGFFLLIITGMLHIHWRMRTVVLIAGVAAVFVAWFIYYRAYQEPAAEPYLNSVLAIRGFRHAALNVFLGESKDYEIYVGEEFKVTWKTESLSEEGQLLYRGPVGVGVGLVHIQPQALASQSNSPFLDFIPTKAGIATFTLTITGPGIDGIYTIPSTLTVNIIP
jgi:hypothetical protein